MQPLVQVVYGISSVSYQPLYIMFHELFKGVFWAQFLIAQVSSLEKLIDLIA